MASPVGYRQLRVWRESISLVESVFKLTPRLPDERKFCLVSQMERAAISIPSNIAEGHAKRSSKDYHRHLKIAAGFLAELETQIELVVPLGLADRKIVVDDWKISQTLARMLSRLIDSVSVTAKKITSRQTAETENPQKSKS